MIVKKTRCESEMGKGQGASLFWFATYFSDTGKSDYGIKIMSIMPIWGERK